MPDEQQPLKLTIDGREVEAHPNELLIAAAERSGTYIPRFCYHPRMKPVGMCRMCLVEIEGPRGKALQPACMIPVTEGMVVDTQSNVVKKAQDGILEFLLVNHPLDCPVCDRGGECPLQDQTLTYGPGESRFVEEKRHFEKPIPLSDLVLLDRERCIQCSRCVRFADEIAGDPLINFVDRGNQLQILTFPDEPFASYFSGNTVQICPVGALLATPYRFKARPWDLDQTESTCTACSVGCRIAVQSSRDELVRYLGIDAEPVNHGWLCDKGRFSYEAINSEDRLAQPLVRKTDELVEASWGEALTEATDQLRRVRDGSGPGAIAVLGGARLTNEDAYAWAKLAKSVLGTDNVDCQLGDGLPAEIIQSMPRATIDEACEAGAVVLIAPDLKEELPVLYLRLREAAVEKDLPILEITPQPTGMSRHAKASLAYRPGEAGALVRGLVDALQGRAADAAGVRADALSSAAEILGRENVVVVLGRPSLAESADSVAEAAMVLAEAVPGTRFLSALRRGNVQGALDMGLAPGFLPGRVSLDDGREWFGQEWGVFPEERGLDASGILNAAAEGRIQALVLLGADPLGNFPDRTLARRALAGVGFILAVDTFLSDSVREADVVLPAAMFAEKEGTTTNLEGRVSRVTKKVNGPGTARPDWMIAVELALRLGGDLGFESVDDVWAEVERLAPSHSGVTTELLATPGYRDGVVVPFDTGAAPPSALAQTALESIEVSAVERHVSVDQSQDQGEPPAPAPDAEPMPHGSIQDEKGAQADGVPEPGPGSLQQGEQEGAPAAAAAEQETRAVEAEGEPAGHPSDDDHETGNGGAVVGGGGGGPSLAPFPRSQQGAASPPLDAYSLRLVSSRSLYDAGVLTAHAPSLAGLAPAASLRANPYDLDRLGVTTGGQVRVSSPRGSLVLQVVADAAVSRGTAALRFNEPGAGAVELIDATAPVTDIRLETV